MYNIGQADNLLSAGKVSYPSHISCANYPCPYIPPDTKKRPVSIPLGTYNNEPNYIERYIENTQQKRAGEISDKSLLLLMIVLLVVLSICTFISFNYERM